jgi:mono/diheme cytochrome c family protein
MMSQADRNQDQKLSKEEFNALPDAWFDALDTDGIERVSQDEFNERFGNLLPPPPGFGQRGTGLPTGGRGGFASSRYVGFFSVLDSDKDGFLTRAELKTTFEKWFDEWSKASDASLDRDQLIAGFNSVLPRTNMGGATGSEAQVPIPGLPQPPPSPVLAPADAIKTLYLPEGFRAELAASEPMIEDPITMAFDEDGRLFVVEMRGFMVDINRTGEREPVGRISRLEDTDGDGRFDKSSVFVDQLVLPRAVAAVSGGILYVSDYKLWFAQDTDGDGKADGTALVDDAYGSGNVEHGPNGLLRAVDNWIYNAESQYRYRFVSGVLIKQRTEFRGQWGMTHDNYGRLFYNVNNSQLLGDFAPPNYMGRNPHHRTSAGLNLAVATDQRVFTIRMKTAVNRGYLTNVLDATGKLYVFASSCSPLIYRGDNFPDEFHGNAFVCDPSANLIKRNLVFDQNLTLSSRFAYTNSEFLASTDERFRPSNIFNGPDGTLWVVDMYRGIIQYGMFMTSYLRRDTLERGLDKGIHLGRIYRIVSKDKAPGRFPQLSKLSLRALTERLSDPNGWVRDMAQRLLVERGDRSVLAELARLTVSGASPLGRIHALWTLEGLLLALPKDALISKSAIRNPQSVIDSSPAARTLRLLNVEPTLGLEPPDLTQEVLNACLKAAGDSHPKVQVAAIRVAEALTASNRAHQKTLLQNLMALNPPLAPPRRGTAPSGVSDSSSGRGESVGSRGRLAAAASTEEPDKGAASEVIFQAALTAGNLAKPESLPLLASIADSHAEHSLIRHAILSGLRDWKLQFLQILLADPRWQSSQPGRGALLQALASAIVNERDARKTETLLALAAGQKPGQFWRRKSLLDGMAVPAQNRFFQPIDLSAPPTALEALGKSEDAAVRDQSERLKKLFAWPGHPDASVAATTDAARLAIPGAEAALDEGKLLYQQICAGCHGLDGEGLTPLAPPLVNSDWVRGSEARLVRIALHGVAGPLHVNGTRYEPPMTLPDMPSLRDALDNNQIAAVLSFIRQSFGNDAAAVSPSRVAAIRVEAEKRETPWTETELLGIE